MAAGRGTFTCHLSPQEADAEGLKVKGQPGLAQETLSEKKKGLCQKSEWRLVDIILLDKNYLFLN